MVVAVHRSGFSKASDNQTYQVVTVDSMVRLLGKLDPGLQHTGVR